MANSLQSQLLKSGLTDSKKAKKAHQQKLEAGKAAANDIKEQVKQAQRDKAERDKALNRQQQDDIERKAIIAQIKQLINLNKIDRSRGETAYQFTDQNKIKKLYVTDALLNQLTKGQIAVVKQGEAYELIPARVAEKIAQRDAALVVVFNITTEATVLAEDDPYANYQIPDDLMW